MAYREGHRVRSVVGLGYRVQTEDILHHLLHLVLLSLAVAYDRLLHLHWRVFVDLDVPLHSRQQDYPARLRNIDSGGLVVGEI